MLLRTSSDAPWFQVFKMKPLSFVTLFVQIFRSASRALARKDAESAKLEFIPKLHLTWIGSRACWSSKRLRDEDNIFSDYFIKGHCKSENSKLEYT